MNQLDFAEKIKQGIRVESFWMVTKNENQIFYPFPIWAENTKFTPLKKLN